MSDSELQQVRDDYAQLARKVDLLESRESIATCIRRVARAIDRLDRDLLASQFHPDARVDYGKIYRGPIAGFLDVTMQFQGGMRDTQHLVGNMDISVTGDSAHAESYVHAHHVLEIAGERTELIVGGRYLDRFERRGDIWKIAFRSEVIDWGRHVLITERWFEDNNELPKGRRDRDDASYTLQDRKHSD